MDRRNDQNAWELSRGLDKLPRTGSQQMLISLLQWGRRVIGGMGEDIMVFFDLGNFSSLTLTLFVFPAIGYL